MITNVEIFLFSIFSIFSILSASLVILLNNAVQSVLFLVLTFFNVACLLMLLGAEFFAFLLIIVYVGAIAVLFLFVIMMLNLNLQTNQFQFSILLPIAGVTIGLFIFQFNPLLDQTDLLRFCSVDSTLVWTSWLDNRNIQENIIVIGKVLYSTYGILFILASLILLVAMIGAIVLTMHYKLSLKGQNINLQLVRNPKDVIKFVYIRK